MAQIIVSRSSTINAAADHLWKILAVDFAQVDRWVTVVTESSSIPAKSRLSTLDADDAPAGRLCEVEGFGLTDERVTHFDPESRKFGYTISANKMPGFVKRAQNSWEIIPDGTLRSTVVANATADAAGIMGSLMKPVLRRKFGKTIEQFFEDLRAYAETGEVSASKRKALDKQQRVG